MFPSNYLNSKVFSLLCSAIPSICHAPLEQISDKDPSLNDPDQMAAWLTRYPAGTSFKSLEHFSQIIQSKKF